MINKIGFTALVLVLSATAARADESKIYTQDGKYLGKIGASQYDAESVTNPVGRYGSKLSPDSINNPFGQYGSGVTTPAAEPFTIKKAAPYAPAPVFMRTEEPAAPAPDFSGLSTLGAPGSGLQFKTDAPPAATVETAPAVEPAPVEEFPPSPPCAGLDPIECLDLIRKGATK